MLPTLDREQARSVVELRRALAASDDAEEQAQARAAWSDPVAFARLLELGLSSRSEVARRLATRLRKSLEENGHKPFLGHGVAADASAGHANATDGAAEDTPSAKPSVVRVYRGARVS